MYNLEGSLEKLKLSRFIPLISLILYLLPRNSRVVRRNWLIPAVVYSRSGGVPNVKVELFNKNVVKRFEVV